MSSAGPESSRAVILCRQLGPREGLEPEARKAWDQLQAGNRCLDLPLVSFCDVAGERGRRLEAARLELERGDFDLLVFTSARGVESWPASAPAATGGAALAAVGKRTAAAAMRCFDATEVISPTTMSASGLAAELGARPELIRGARVLLVRVDIADDSLPTALRDAGAKHVEAVVGYENAGADPEASQVLQLELARNPRALLLTSPSSVQALVKILVKILVNTHADTRAGMRGDLPDDLIVASIGPSTTKALVATGLDVSLTADPHTLAALLTQVLSRIETESPDPLEELAEGSRGPVEAICDTNWNACTAELYNRGVTLD